MKMRTGSSIFLIALALAGCNSVGSLLEGDKIDYKSAGKLPSLELPPDLVRPSADERYTVPDANRGSATLSTYNSTRQDPNRNTASAPVLPDVTQARIERSGSQRWLVVNRPAEQLWPIVRDFWQQAGFLLNMDSPETGIMETDWAENRAKIPQDAIRATIGKVFDGLYSTPERDKFRTRLEKTDKGTEIFISHRGMLEAYTSSNKDQTTWQPRPADPELEAEFLRRLMLVLGVDSERAQAQIAAAPQADRAQLIREGNLAVGLRVNEGFDRSWRRVGLALDRIGFTVEDRDRSKGLYFVRYVDPEIDNQSGQKNQGFFGKLFSFSSSKTDKPTQFRISVNSGTQAESSQIAIQNKDGEPERGETAARILTLLHGQLK